MSYVHRILTSMNEHCIYRACDVAQAAKIDTKEAARVLGHLVRGG